MTTTDQRVYNAAVSECEAALCIAVNRCITEYIAGTGCDQDVAINLFSSALLNLANGGKR